MEQVGFLKLCSQQPLPPNLSQGPETRVAPDEDSD